MVAPTDLIRQWQSKHDENLRLVADGSVHWRWLRFTYVRLYRFLLATYAQPSAACHDEHRPDTAEPYVVSGQRLHDDAAEIKLVPPKSDGRIRSTLKSLHRANDRSSKRGPLALGLHNDNWVVAAEHRQFVPADDYRSLLRRWSIESRIQSRGARYFVEVRLGNAEQVARLLENRKQRPVRRWESLTLRNHTIACRRKRFLKWGVGLGLLAAAPTYVSGAIFVGATWAAVAAAAGFCAGAMVGVVIGLLEDQGR